MKKDIIEDIYALSPLQEGMLFHTIYAQNSGIYILQMKCTFRSKLDTIAFKRAWQQVIKRHPILRTAFYWEELDHPVQVVHSHVDLPWEELDWQMLPHFQQDDDLDRLMQKDRKRGFELSQAPLLRITLIRSAEDIYHCIWSRHHLLEDGWSLSIVLREVLTSYNAFVQGMIPPLEPCYPYGDYITWLQKQDLSQAEIFWRHMLKGFTSPTTLGNQTEIQKLHDQPIIRAEWETIVSSNISQALSVLARKQQLTVNTLIQGAWALLLSHYSNKQDIIFGVTVAGRPVSLKGVESIVGPFINTLPMRVSVPGNALLLSWLKEIQTRLMEMCQFEATPLVQIHGWSDMPRTLPLFESILVFESVSTRDIARGKQAENMLEIIAVHSVEHTNYPLTIIIVPDRNISLHISYDTTFFDEATIECVMKHFLILLEGMVSRPQARLADFPLLTPSERQQIVYDWNATATDYDTTLCLQQFFEAQVVRRPDSVALLFEQQDLTFSKLNSRANQLAHFLQRQGVGPEVCVGICLERSLELIIGLLAVLKAGGTFVPLDPNSPRERIQYLLNDAHIRHILIQAGLKEKLLFSIDNVICLDTEWDDIAQMAENNPDSVTFAQNAAYIIYTSGSTGQPKGVIAPHSACLNRLAWMWQQYPFSADDICCQKTALSFVDSIWEIFGPLLAGVPLVLFTDQTVRDPEQLLQELANWQVSRLILVPTLLRALLDSKIDFQTALPHLKHWTSSGEVLSTYLCQQFQSQVPYGMLLNLYGSSEVAADVTYYVTSPDHSASPTTPIGRPIANTQIYILNTYLHPVPVGVPGMLYVGGACLSHGYLSQPDLTAERFVPDPFHRKPGTRLYRTGDVARYQANGAIEFLGRWDLQVKLRGMRIELEEIESVLLSYPAIQACAVALRDSEEKQHLVAYIVPRADIDIHRTDLRIFLQKQLPEHMIPSLFFLLDKIPLTPSGKIARSVLATLHSSALILQEQTVTPSNPIEEIIATIWLQVLNRKQISLTDNFFEIGGHSLLAIQVVVRLREILGIELPLRTFFSIPRISELSRWVEKTQWPPYKQDLPRPTLTRQSHEVDIQLSFAQQRLWFLDQLEPGSSSYNISTSVQIRGALNLAALQQSFNVLLQRHETLRTTFVLQGSLPIQIIGAAFNLSISLVDLQKLPTADEQEQETQRLTLEEAQRPFDLSKGPLLRITLLRSDTEKHCLLVNMHHIISDRWSMDILLREIVILYNAATQGQSITLSSLLPPLPVSYADFAIWQRGWLQGPVLSTLLDYWLQCLHGIPQLLQLPTDRPRPERQSMHGAQLALMIDADILQQIISLCAQEGVTLFMFLLATFQILLSFYTGSEDIVVGTDIANRTMLETEGLIGFFVNQIVLRVDLSDNLTFRELLKRVREVALEAYAHQELPFDVLVASLAQERNLQYSPVFQVKFSLQNVMEQVIDTTPLQLTSTEIDKGTTQLDLNVRAIKVATGLKLSAEYCTDLFNAGTIELLLSNFAALLRFVSVNLDLKQNALKQRLFELEKERKSKIAQDLILLNMQKIKKIKRKSYKND